MEIKINALHFNVAEQLSEFIDKKVKKFGKLSEDISQVELTLKVVKPESANNKEVSIRVVLPCAELFAEKTCDTFEEAIDLNLDSLKRQLEKHKAKK